MPPREMPKFTICNNKTQADKKNIYIYCIKQTLLYWGYLLQLIIRVIPKNPKNPSAYYTGVFRAVSTYTW